MKRACLLAAITAAGLCAQSRHTAEQRFELFNQYLVRRAAEVTKQSLPGIDSLAAWKQRRPAIRHEVLHMLGLDRMPKKTPLNVRVTRTFEREKYRVENIVFQSMPGLYVTGNLYVPKGVQGRMPAVLYLCGHAPGPWGAKVHYQHHGIWLASHGYVAFLIDTIEFGEVPGIHHGTHDLEMWDWLSLGYTPAGPEVWNAIRALDYLETRPEVDSQRMAVTGISGGGAMTWYTAAVDDRIQAGASVCATWTVADHTALDAVHENCDCIYFTNIFQRDLSTVGALIAPRPFKMLSARRDPSFPIPGYKGAFRDTLPIYDLYNAAAKVAEYDHDAPHQDIPAFRKEAYEWLNHWLKNDDTPYEEGAIEREEAATLTVLDSIPADAINDQVHRTFIPAHKPQPWTSLAGWKQRREKLLGVLREEVFRAFPKDKVDFEVWKSAEKGWSSRYADAWNVEFTTEAGIRVHGQLFIPRQPERRNKALVYFKGREDVVYPIDYDLILPALGRQVVLVLHPRGVDYAMSNYKLATVKRTAALIGATLESMQVWDLLRSIDFLTDAEGLRLSEIAVYGRRHMGPLALYAAAMDDRITRVILDDPPRTHWQREPALLNVLRHTDLVEAAGLMAPRQIVSMTPLPEAWNYTRGIFQLYRHPERFREVQGLSEALQ